MTLAILFTIAIAIILLRVFILHLHANDIDNEEFKVLPREVKLAVLKERLLETPSEAALKSLCEFLKGESIEVDPESYRPLLTEQLRISREENALALDDSLYEKESAWMDAIEPMEFANAMKYKAKGENQAYIETYLSGILRYYSDEKIVAALTSIIPDYPEAQKFLDDYRALINLRDSSLADDNSLEKLTQAKEAWVNEITGG